jgi:hypothetical protein
VKLKRVLSENLEEFLEASRQRDEGVRLLSAECFAGIHRAGDVELGDAG